jgi:hypothetical protein
MHNIYIKLTVNQNTLIIKQKNYKCVNQISTWNAAPLIYIISYGKFVSNIISPYMRLFWNATIMLVGNYL